MEVVSFIAVFLFIIVLPVMTVLLLVRPHLLARVFKGKTPGRRKIIGLSLLVGVILFVTIGITAPPESDETRLAREARAQSRQLEKAQQKVDKDNSKIASKVELHNAHIYRGNDKRYTYDIVASSRQYDVRVNLLDASKKTVASQELNHSHASWLVVTDKSPESVKYLTYAVSVGGTFYDSGQVLDISQDFVDYPKLANEVRITNTKVVKENNAFSYLISANEKSYDVKLDFYNSDDEVVYAKTFNHKDASWDVKSIQNSPVSQSGDIVYIKPRVSIGSSYYDVDYRVGISDNWQDIDAEKEAARIAEEARKAEEERQRIAQEQQAAAAAEAQRRQQEATARQEASRDQQPAAPSGGGAVKKSRSGICHAPGTQYYDQTKTYTSYNSLQECLNSGGRLPK